MAIRGVQGKIPCLFETVVEDIPTNKRPGQSYRIIASKTISKTALKSNVKRTDATEKIDGTCCFITHTKGEISMLARLDRKPIKKVEKRFKQFQTKRWKWIHMSQEGKEPVFQWNYPHDFKEVPLSWIPALNVEKHPTLGHPIPNENGHIPGWVPITHDKRQYRWHHSVINIDMGLAIILRNFEFSKSLPESHPPNLELTIVPLSELEGKTLELIGTNVNGNPYGLGCKQYPFHVLIVHGEMKVHCLPDNLEYDDLQAWFQKSDVNSAIEGIVFHCKDSIYKVHRQHLCMKWPIKEENGHIGKPALCQRRVTVNSQTIQDEPDDNMREHEQFAIVKKLNFKTFDSLQNIPFT